MQKSIVRIKNIGLGEISPEFNHADVYFLPTHYVSCSLSKETTEYLWSFKKRDQLNALMKAEFEVNIAPIACSNYDYQVVTIKPTSPVRLLDPVPEFKSTAERIEWIGKVFSSLKGFPVTSFNCLTISCMLPLHKYAFGNCEIGRVEDEMEGSSFSIIVSGKYAIEISTKYGKNSLTHGTIEHFDIFFSDFVKAYRIGSGYEKPKSLKESKSEESSQVEPEGFWSLTRRCLNKLRSKRGL